MTFYDAADHVPVYISFFMSTSRHDSLSKTVECFQLLSVRFYTFLSKVFFSFLFNPLLGRQKIGFMPFPDLKNIVSLQKLVDHGAPHITYFIFCTLPSLFGKERGKVFRCILQAFEFGIFFILD